MKTKIGDKMMDYGGECCLLPYILVAKSRYRLIRICGMLCTFIWMPIGVPLGFLLIFPGLIITMFEEA